MRVSRVANRNASTSPGAARQRVREQQQRPRVALHRAADVAEQHDRPRPGAPPPASAASMISPPVRRLRASARRRSMRLPRPGTHRRVRRSFDVPGQAAPAPSATMRELARRSARQSPCVAMAVEVAPGRERRRVRRHSIGFIESAARLRRLAVRPTRSTHRARLRRHEWRARSPELLEEADRRRRSLRAAGSAARGRRRARLPATPGRRAASASVSVDQAIGVDLQAGAPQQRGRTRSGCRGSATRHARAISSASTPPRIASMSSFAFSSTPIVSCGGLGVERRRDRAPPAPPPSRAFPTRPALCRARAGAAAARPW